LPDVHRPAVGLRERKKAKTRATIREQALRLFRERGYAATTVEQIADAAEVSASTFFRYFPTKEDVVLADDFDPIMLEALRDQPADLNPVQALRNAMHVTFTSLTAEEWQRERERVALIISTAELRTAMLDEFTRSWALATEILAERVGRSANDFALRVFAGALLGAVMAAWLAAMEEPNPDYLQAMDAALAQVEASFPL
jgi:AcrR family transcriptional regulator